MKVWFKRLKPLRFLIVFCLTLSLFVVMLVVSHVTHALTLLVDACNFLCNLVALSGSIITYKYGSSNRNSGCSSAIESEDMKSLASLTQQNKMCCTQPQQQAERKLRNTFGWARLDVLLILVSCVFLMSLYFSILILAVQFLIHISHMDEIHYPLTVLSLGISSVVINSITYLLIGGYTFNTGSFQNSDNSLENLNPEQGSNKNTTVMKVGPKRQGMLAICRDLAGGVFVIICASTVFLVKENVAKYMDPILAIVSVSTLTYLNFSFIRKSSLILLQTIPDHINIESLCTQLLTAFPMIINVHDFHVWELTADKTYTTVHIVLNEPKDYLKISDDVTLFFRSKGIANVTVQPEFHKDLNSIELVSKEELNKCLFPCIGDGCWERHCCNIQQQSLESVQIDQQEPKKNKKKNTTESTSQKCHLKSADLEETKEKENQDKSKRERVINITV